MTVVALTGGIAAGKSTVAEVLSSRGIRVVDADQLAREAVAPGSSGLASIVQRFGPEVQDDAGGLDRQRLGAIIFGDDEARDDLNEIIHPIVRELSQEVFAEHLRNAPEQPLVYAIPLLAESARSGEFDLVVVVHAPREARIERLVANRGMSLDEATSRVDAQSTDQQRLAIADVVLDSSRDRDHTLRGAEELAEALLAYWPDRLGEIPTSLPSSPR